jgi:hypothetical protein
MRHQLPREASCPTCQLHDYLHHEPLRPLYGHEEGHRQEELPRWDYLQGRDALQEQALRLRRDLLLGHEEV